MDENSGLLGKAASWVEYPFTATDFPWKTVLLAAALAAIIIFFVRDGLQVIAETVAE